MSTYAEELGFLYRSQMNHICQIIGYSIFGISTPLVILAAYVIIKKSTPTMGHYKYLLLNQLLWNFFFDSLLTLWQPVPIFNAQNATGLSNKFIMFYSNGFFRDYGPYSIFIIFSIVFLAIIGMTHSLYICMIYRVLAVFYDSRLGLLIQEPVWLRRIFFGSLGIAILVFEWPILFLEFYPKDIHILYNNSIKAMPAMEEVIRLEPSTSGCDVPTCGTVTVYLIAGMEGFAVLAIPVSICVIGAIYYRRTKYLTTQTTMSSTTMNLNRMLMMALQVHAWIIAIFLVFPAMLLFALTFGSEKYNFISEVIMIIFTCHSLFDIPAMFFFIKPYRMFMIEILLAALKKVGLDRFLHNDQVQVIQQVQSSTGINSGQIGHRNRA